MSGTFIEGFGSAEKFTWNASAPFGWATERGFVECGRFHHSVKGFGVISLPGFVAGFDLDISTLGDV